MTTYTMEWKNPIIYNPIDRVVYSHDLSEVNDDYTYRNPIVNARIYNSANSLAGSIQEKNEAKIRAFYNNGTEETNYRDMAVSAFDQVNKAVETGDKSVAAAIITSKEYTVLQDTVVLGTNEELIRTGILVGLFEEIATPSLTGKFLNFANDVQYFTNLPESKSPEPTFGAASTTTVEVPKHGGSVAITDRARQVINQGTDVFSRLVGQLQQKRLKSENELTAEEIETIDGVSPITGVDFGLRAGTPPLSSTTPSAVWTSIINYFEGTVSGADFNTIVSKGFIYNEYVSNDQVRGLYQPINNQSAVNEQSSSVPGISGVTWVRDDTMDSSTIIYVLDRTKCIKIFRGPTIAYTVRDPDTETEKYVTKSHMLPKTVDNTAIRAVTGSAA